MEVVSNYPSLKDICAILMYPMSFTLLKILNYCLGSIGGLLKKVSQSMGSIICVEKIDLFSTWEAIRIK